jgi:hypothetical protein
MNADVAEFVIAHLGQFADGLAISEPSVELLGNGFDRGHAPLLPVQKVKAACVATSGLSLRGRPRLGGRSCKIGRSVEVPYSALVCALWQMGLLTNAKV